ncbi:MFS transporter [Trujillonella endophytica]|uniref:Predicted arabinose efflux permease, MFS family n=1 Tax=Trujillonella endophytica TaxID=673521 RepID=A0A1H8R4N7_9ACTN|nr:MFS transporter [Trujillella endophytica]SEO60873.1 Predicted arabinose efflux permease, MFS family [Trujillella endophytica]
MTEDPPATRDPTSNVQATFGEVFAVPEFRPLFGSYLLSTIGDQLARVALTVLVYQRTDSPLLSAITFAVSYLPWLVGGPVLATLADRLPRHRVLIASDVARAVLVAGMAVPGTPLALLLVLLLLVSLFAPPFESARSALMADVLTGDRYAVATSLTNVSSQMSQVVGFALAGTLMATLSPSWVLLLNAVTFAVSALWLGAGLERRPAPAVEAGGGHRSLWRDAGDGLRLITRTPRLLSLVLLVWVGVMFANAAEGISAPLVDELGGGATAVGLLLAANPLGVTIGGLLLTRLVTPSRRNRLVPPLVLLSLLPVLAAGLVTMWAPPGEVAFGAVLACMFVAGLGASWTIPLNVTFVREVPSAYRGRAIGVAVSGLYGVQGLGALGAGLAAEGVSAGAVVALIGGLGVLAVVPPLLAWARLQADAVAGTAVPAGP